MIHSIGDRVIATKDGVDQRAVIYPVPVQERDQSLSSVYSRGKVWVRIHGLTEPVPWPAEDVRRHS